MLETISDYISIVIMMMFPLTLLGAAVRSFMKRRKAKILANSEKYYREW